jgi:uncharacterized protein (DUF433 family)
MTTRTITASPDILGGMAVFAGTRVPVQIFIEYLKAGESIESFLEGFPSAKREQLLASWMRREMVHFFLAFTIASSTESSTFQL